METLLAAIKQNQDIKGIVVEDKEIKCIAFTYDLTNLLRDKVNVHDQGLKLIRTKKEAY